MSQEGQEKQEFAKSYWMSCDPIYSDDRYLALVAEDETHVTMVVFWCPKNRLEIGREIKVLRDLLEPGPEGYVEISKEELIAAGVVLP